MSGFKTFRNWIVEYGETNMPSVNPAENAYKKIHGQQYIMDSTEESEDEEKEDDES